MSSTPSFLESIPFPLSLCERSSTCQFAHVSLLSPKLKTKVRNLPLQRIGEREGEKEEKVHGRDHNYESKVLLK